MNSITYCDPSIGNVVLIQSEAGLRTLAVVVEVVERAQGPDTGKWCLVMDNSASLVVPIQKRAGESPWIAHHNPTCPQRGASRWWWFQHGPIVCAQCVPPVSRWSLWQDIHEGLKDMSASDPQHAPLLALLSEADEAMEHDNWPLFQQIVVRLWRLVRHGSEARSA